MKCGCFCPFGGRYVLKRGRIFNIFDLQTFKVTIDFTPRRRIVGPGTVQERIANQEDAYIEKMGELALLQRDGDGEATEGDTDEWSDFKNGRGC